MEEYYDLSESNDMELLKEVSIGNLQVPTGSIIASDPFFTFETKPFVRKVEPGVYPVKIYIAEVEPDHFRVAFAKLKIKDEKAESWISATVEGIDLEEDEIAAFPVDAGLGCFIDEKSNRSYQLKTDAFYKNNPEGNYYDDVLAAEFARSEGHEYSRELGDWNDHVVDESGLNAIMFASGWGDGFYPVYWGLNDKQEIVELTVDFLIGFDDDEE